MAAGSKTKPRPSWWALSFAIFGWIVAWFLLDALSMIRMTPQQALFGMGGFAMLGLVSGLYLIYSMRQSPYRRFRLALVLAYLVVVPISAFAALQGPLIVVNPAWYLLVMPAYGLFPLIVAVRVAIWIGEGLRDTP